MSANKFQKKLQQKRVHQKNESPVSVAAVSIAARTTEAPHGQPEASRMMSQIARSPLEPAGQIIRVPIDEVYEVEQVRPEDDFEEETLAGMADSFSEFGNLTPPRCFPKDRNGYRVWFGATRIRSMRRRGDTHVDIYVGKPPRDEKQRIMGQLIENLQQSGLKPLATALAFEKLKSEHNMTGEQIAKSLGKPTAFVSKHLRIGAAPEKIKVLMKAQKLSDVDLIYTLLQVNELSEDSADRLIDIVESGKTLTRASVKDVLDQLKGRTPKQTQKGQIRQKISHAKSEPEMGESQEATADSENPVTPDLSHVEREILNHPEAPELGIPEGKQARLKPVVMFQGTRGFLLLDKVPEEWGYVWIRTSEGEFHIEASEVTLLGVS